MSRSRERTPLLVGAVLAVCAAAAACAPAAADEVGRGEADVQEQKTLFGDDRVGRALSQNLDKVPSTFQEFEKLFQVGRACARTDSKEMFVVEESSSRLNGEQSQGDGLLPRSVITGCNTGDHTSSDSLTRSASLMAALISDFDAPDHRDPMVFTPVESMALDETTGAYNFYVFEPTGDGKPGTVTRILREPNGDVVQIKLAGGTSEPKKTASQDKRCFNCHVNGAPLMNELGRPWTNWVSVLNTLPKERLSGETASVVDEAAPVSGGHSRSSFANDLEQIIKSGIRTWSNGIPAKPGTGFGARTLEGSSFGGIPRLLRSVFCQTELNYASSADTVPLDLFVDRDAVAGAELVEPGSIPGTTFPFQLPIRSEADKRVEKFLQKAGFLTPRTVAAIRLVDDEHDVFSDTRCGLHAEVTKTSFSADRPAEVDRTTREVLSARLAANKLGAISKERAALMTTLLDPEKSDADVAAARATYFADDLSPRYRKLIEQVEGEEGRKALAKRVDAAKQNAREMFPGRANPLPVLDRETHE